MRQTTREILDGLEAARDELVEAMWAGRRKVGTPWYADRERQLVTIERQIARLILSN